MPMNVPSDAGPLTYGMDGNLGVGVANPSKRLDVSGDARITGDITITGAITSGSTPAGGFTLSPRCLHTGGMSITQTTDGNDSTPSATETYIAEIMVPANVTVTGIAVFNGSAVGTDKLVAYLCDSTGAVVANSDLAGTTAVGTDAFQALDLVTPYEAVGPATYYVALQCDGTTYRFNSHILGVFGASKKTATTFGELASVTPPTTFTTALGPIASLY